MSCVKLHDVIDAYSLKIINPSNNKGDKKRKVVVKQKAIKKVGWTNNIYTSHEDEGILAAINEAEDRGQVVNYTALAVKLNRKHGSVHRRVMTLKGNGGVKEKRRFFTLVQDQVVLETLIIPRLRSKKLHNVILKMNDSDVSKLSKQWNKTPVAIMNHWMNSLQPMLLQHYSGTLNLRRGCSPTLSLETSLTFLLLTGVVWLLEASLPDIQRRVSGTDTL